MPETEKRIPKVIGYIMIAAAAFVDSVQFVLDIFLIGIFLNPFIDLIIGGSLWLFTLIKGIPLVGSPKLLGATAVTFLFEMTPFGALPLWTMDIWYLVYTVQREDNTNAEQAADTAQKASKALGLAATAAKILAPEVALPLSLAAKGAKMEAKNKEAAAREREAKTLNTVENPIEEEGNQSYNYNYKGYDEALLDQRTTNPKVDSEFDVKHLR